MHRYNIIEQGQSLEKATKALLLIHGRYGNAQDMLSLSTELCDDSFYMAAPQATNDSWYPSSFMSEESENEPWLSSAIDTIHRLIHDTSRFIPKEHIYLGGFSQGACLSLEYSSRHAEFYGGILAFSGGLIGKKLNLTHYKGNFAGTKVYIGISDHDPYIPLSRSKESKDVMEKLGANVTLQVFPGTSHTVNGDEIHWVKQNILYTSEKTIF